MPQQVFAADTTCVDDDENDLDEEEEDSLLFSCRCESAKSVGTLLSSLRHFGGSGNSNNVSNNDSNFHTSSAGYGSSRQQLCTVYVTETSLTFHVQGLARQSQASADMQEGLFSDFYVSSEEVTMEGEDGKVTKKVVYGGEFCVNLVSVLDCIGVLGVANMDRTKICMSYDRESCIFKIELEENGVLSTCAILGSLPDGDYDDEDEDKVGLAAAFSSCDIVARGILKSDYLKDAINELLDMKQAGATCCTVGFSSERMEMGAAGYRGECLVHLPKNKDIFLSLQCEPPKRLITRNYPINSFLQGMRGLDIANETCVSINEHGMIAIQHQVIDTIGNGRPNYIDFIMGALEDAIDEEDDDNDCRSEFDGDSLLKSEDDLEHDSRSCRRIQPTTGSHSESDDDVDQNTEINRDINETVQNSSSAREEDDDHDLGPTMLLGNSTSRGEKRRSPHNKASSQQVTLTHHTVNTHYSDSSEDEFEFN